MTKNIICFLLMASLQVVFGENTSKNCSSTIYIKDYNLTCTIHHDIDTIELKKNQLIIIQKLNCKGDFYFKEYSHYRLQKEGSYISRADTSIIIDMVTDVETPTIIKDTLIGFNLVKAGQWKYYNKKGKLIKTVMF